MDEQKNELGKELEALSEDSEMMACYPAAIEYLTFLMESYAPENFYTRRELFVARLAGNVPLSLQAKTTVLAAVRNDKIGGLKEVRKIFGSDLRSSKEFVEDLMDGTNWEVAYARFAKSGSIKNRTYYSLEGN